MNGPRRVTAALIPLLLVGCASSGGGGLSDPSEVRRDMGRGTYPDVLAAVEKILETKNRYVIQRFEENYNAIWFETEWHVSDPLEDELAQGIDRIRTRIVIDGRRSTNDTFRLRFTATVESLRGGSQEWARLPVTEMRGEEIQSLLSDMDMEIRSGVRGG